ncbi:MAG: transcription termination factor NusA [Gemmatimonadaceae bacterium]
MSADILIALRELTNSKQLDRSELHGLIQDGIYAALAKRHGPTVQAEVDIDESKGSIKIVLLKTVVEEVTDPAREIALEEARMTDEEFQVGDMMEEPVDFAEFGRTAVQAAKQRIIQRVREGERTRIRDEFTSRVGELLSGEVQQIERGKLVVMLNKFREAEAIIPYREQNHREHFHQGEPVRAVLKRVEETPKGPRLVLSRSDAMFVQALFKLEVPEIQQGIVEIRAAAREVGSRTKIAVLSRDDAVDPVGACVGIKGSRVQAVVNELAGERIDIVPWSQDPERFAKLALAPARVARVFSDPATKTIQAVVDEDQLSLAIGRNGQNVRLASELTEWKIDLYSSREWMERAGDQPIFAPLPDDDSAVNPRLAEIDGISAATSAVLEEAGYKRLDDIIDLEREDFLRLAGIAPEEADRLMSIITELTTDDAAAEAASSAPGDAAENEGMAADPAEESAVGIDPRAAPLPGNEEALREINEGTADTEDFGAPVPGGEDANEMAKDAPPAEAAPKAKSKAKGKVKAEG